MASIASGVPQGSVLSPFLFLIYVDDLASQLKCPSFIFADDVKVVGSIDMEDIIRDVEHVVNLSREWDLPINVAKSHLLSAASERLVVELDGAREGFDVVRKVRDLGVTVTSDFK